MYRPRHSASALRWSSSLEASAQQWANRCVFEHQQGSGQGENLAWGYSDNIAAIDAYYAENSKYTYGQANPSNFHEVGHFTQVGGHVGRVTDGWTRCMFGVGAILSTSPGLGRGTLDASGEAGV